MAKNDFSKLKSMLELSSGFSLSEQQYEKIIGRKMPKSSKYYLAKKSALAEFAKEMLDPKVDWRPLLNATIRNAEKKVWTIPTSRRSPYSSIPKPAAARWTLRSCSTALSV